MAVAFYNEAGKGDPFELPALYLLIALVARRSPAPARCPWIGSVRAAAIRR